MSKCDKEKLTGGDQIPSSSVSLFSIPISKQGSSLSLPIPLDPRPAMKLRASASDFKSLSLTLAMANGDDDDDDFQNPSQAVAITQNLIFSSLKSPNYQEPLKASNGAPPPRKKQKHLVSSGKENRRGNQVPKSNDSRVSNVCSKGKGVKVKRGNHSGTIGSGSVAITKFDERSGVDESCGLTPESNLVVNLQNGDSKAVGEERRQLFGSIVSGSVVIQSTPVSDSCFLSTCDQTKSCSVEPIEGDEAKEEKSPPLPSGDSNIVKNCQNGEFGIEDFNVHGVISNLKAEEESLYSMSIESRLYKSKSKLSELNVGDGCGDFELGTQEKTSKVMRNLEIQAFDFKNSGGCEDNVCLKAGKGSYYSMSVESRLLESRVKCDSSNAGDCCGDFEPGTPLNVLMDLCCETGEDGNSFGDESFVLEGDGLVECPLCRTDISHLSEELRQVHTNDCLDKDVEAAIPAGEIKSDSRQEVADVNPVLEWLRRLGLSRYEAAFVKEEVDWETLQWLTEEDLLNMGVVALGPRKKIVHALSELRQKKNCGQPGEGTEKDNSIMTTNEKTKTLVPGNKLITEYFQGPAIGKNRHCSLNNTRHGIEKTSKDSLRSRVGPRSHVSRGKVRDIPPWCCIPGTPFRVDAFRFLRGDCWHWFLTHFHMDHYQGLTKSFCHGKIYCSSVTAHLVNTKIGVQWERLQILPLNQKITVAGVNLTCLDANHCPGSIIILFEPPNGKAVLHTGDFRFSAELAASSVLQSCHVHTLILDTTYCNPQYDFPKQEAVIQFVIEAIQAEAFNPKTLFLIGTYTIGKERLFLEVARLLKKKIYVGAAKLRLLRCLELPEEDMQWFTANEMESHIHVVPMWTIASFKRMKHISNQYSGRFNLIVAFSPTGWTFGKGKKKTPGRRWQQGTIIRYEVPYSEHCSFTELREFVQFISPENIIPSVNNEGPESADAMIALLMSDPQN